MATRRYKAQPGTELVVSEAGAAVNSHAVELTVELATTAVNEGATTRAIKKEEVLAQIEKIKQAIITGNWTPA